MATDYFSCTFYGVELTGAARDLFDSLYAAARDRLIKGYAKAQELEGTPVDPADAEELWQEHLLDFDKDEFDLVVGAIPHDRLASVRKRVGAPDDARFVHTGDDDDRPGRCATGAGAVLVGFGIDAALRLARERFAPRFRNSVHFHSWVEAG